MRQSCSVNVLSWSSQIAQVIGFLRVGVLVKSRPRIFMWAFTRALQLGHDVFTDGTQGGKDAFTLKGDGFKAGDAATVEVAIQHVYR